MVAPLPSKPEDPSLGADRIARLERAIGYAIEQELPPYEIIAMLFDLVRKTAGTDALGASARLALVQRLLSGNPELPTPNERAIWECAKLCRQALAGPLTSVEKGAALALLGLSYSQLGCFRSARQAYFQALRERPGDPVIAHNLGHLLQVRLGQPAAARKWLRMAHQKLPSDPEIAASYAYALLACDDYEQAVDVLSVALGSREQAREQARKWTTA